MQVRIMSLLPCGVLQHIIETYSAIGIYTGVDSGAVLIRSYRIDWYSRIVHCSGYVTQCATIERREAEATDQTTKGGCSHVGTNWVVRNDVGAKLTNSTEQATFKHGVCSLLAEAGKAPALDKGVLRLNVCASGVGESLVP